VSWSEGDVVVRREVLNDGRCWLELPVIVVRDEPRLLVTYIANGAPMRYPLGFHPWFPKERWQGNGVLMLHRPHDAHAVWVFWHGEEREFAGWYINFQEPYRRRAGGYDTQDLELDIWVPRDGAWQWKDRHLLEQRVAEGRFTREQADATRGEAELVAAGLDRGDRWWDESWARWTPDPAWPVPSFSD
jgi:Protein of unknown function (DUF402)